MSESVWFKAVENLKKYVVRIETPTCHGTGFLVPAPAGRGNVRCIVTAFHVVEHADEWQEPIRIVHPEFNRVVFLGPQQRFVIRQRDRDQAVIHFSAAMLSAPAKDLVFAEEDTHYVDGVELGWLGFPSVAPNNECFFYGYISSFWEDKEAYLVDGVAINGVSGGPAFILKNNGECEVVGLVAEYHPNVSAGKPLPGMTVVRSINPLIKYYKSELKKFKTAQLEAASIQKNLEPRAAVTNKQG